MRKRQNIKVPKKKIRRKNIPGNFRGKEDIFFKKVRDGFIEFFKSPFNKRSKR